VRSLRDVLRLDCQLVRAAQHGERTARTLDLVSALVLELHQPARAHRPLDPVGVIT
jgi:hypothetical protein